MSDTITCPNCSATLPSAASFCTSCGNRVTGASTPPPPVSFTPPGSDATRVDQPAPSDATQVYGSPAGTNPPPPPGGQSTAPWQPAPPAGGTWSAPAPPPPTATNPAVPPAPGTPTTATGQTPAWAPGTWEDPNAGRTRPEQPGSTLGAAIAVLGAILTIVGIFMPWVTSNLSDAGLSGWDLTSGDKGFRLPDGALLTFESLDPYALLAIGLGAILVGVMALKGGTRSLSRILGVVLGVAIIGFMVRDWTSLAEVVEQQAPATFEVTSGIGFYLSIAGGALVALSALMPSNSSGTEA